MKIQQKTSAFSFANIFISFILVAPLSCSHALERREITPPLLNSENLGQRILCHRPMREGTPAMDVEQIDYKTIVNNYGHGGSGWALAPGAAKYVIHLWQAAAPKGSNKDKPIAIVGAGALGLFTALELKNQGYNNITIYADRFEALTSHNAGGLLAPVSMQNDPELQKNIDDIGVEAYKFYKAIALKQNQQIPTGAIIVPTYFENREDSGLEPFVGVVMEPAKDVMVDFKNGATHQMVVYDDGIFMDTGALMKSLTQTLKKSKIKFVKKKIHSFSELKQNVIFNCSGMGAKELSNDSKMVSVQGHLIMLQHEKPQDLNYMMLVYFGKDKTKNNQNIKRSFYIFPKKAVNAKPGDIGVLGGTFVENADSSTPNNEEFEIMVASAKKFYGLDKSEH